MRRAGPADRDAIIRFLEARVETAMFPLSNLRQHGMNGGHPRAMKFWLHEDGGDLAGILGVTEAGMVMVQLPETCPAAAGALSGLSLIGLLGPSGPVRAFEAVAGLGELPRTLDRDEPQFALDLADLRVPDGEALLVPLAAAPRETVLTWMRDYQVEALRTSPDAAGARAGEAYDAYLAADSHRVLVVHGTPCAMTGFNAELPTIVQIGGVYTPPPLRGQGFARHAVALHLDEARRRGVGRATLFSASESAARAYSAIGFEPIGHYTLCHFDGPQVAP